MPFKYLIRYKRPPEELLAVEAWPLKKELATEKERFRPSFTIGRLKGSRAILLRPYVREAQERYKYIYSRRTYKVALPIQDISAVAFAYRVGLMAASLSEIDDPVLAENTYRYIASATEEEIWFWASKFLGIIEKQTLKKNVIKALVALAVK